jgi:hypothetical protein
MRMDEPELPRRNLVAATPHEQVVNCHEFVDEHHFVGGSLAVPLPQWGGDRSHGAVANLCDFVEMLANLIDAAEAASPVLAAVA